MVEIMIKIDFLPGNKEVGFLKNELKRCDIESDLTINSLLSTILNGLLAGNLSLVIFFFFFLSFFYFLLIKTLIFWT